MVSDDLRRPVIDELLYQLQTWYVLQEWGGMYQLQEWSVCVAELGVTIKVGGVLMNYS